MKRLFLLSLFWVLNSLSFIHGRAVRGPERQMKEKVLAYGYDDMTAWNEYNYEYAEDIKDVVHGANGTAVQDESEEREREQVMNEYETYNLIQKNNNQPEHANHHDNATRPNHNDDASNDRSREPEVEKFGWDESIADWDYGAHEMDQDEKLTSLIKETISEGNEEDYDGLQERKERKDRKMLDDSAFGYEDDDDERGWYGPYKESHHRKPRH